jgi:pimeloyl-ACP methyl ester carboxylesterase
MALLIEEKGNSAAPLLVCIPGMIGGPSDFRSILEGLDDKFRILLVDINAERREAGLKNLSEESVEAVDYQGSAREIHAYLSEKHPGKGAYFIGLSIGGKVVYHFATDYPKLFKGSVVTDITPGRMEHTELYGTVITAVKNLNLKQPWAALKEELNATIEDKNFRILIKSQLHYPQDPSEARWRNGMWGLEELLKRNTSDELWTSLETVSDQLMNQGSRMIVLKALKMSGLGSEDLERLRKFPFVSITMVENSTHFIHINRTDALQKALLELLGA